MTSSSAAEPQARHLLDARFMWRVFWVFAGLAVLSMCISIAGRYAGRAIAMAGHTDDTTLAEVVIGDNVVAAPHNMIRFSTARRSGAAARLDLYMRWPRLDGYSDEARDDFNHAGGSPNIVFASLTESAMSRDMSGRYEPIYAHITEPSGEDALGGLQVRRFKEASGYMNEILVVGDGDTATPFVARCLDGPSAEQSLAPCERDIHVGDGLSLTYRFPRELLGDWRRLEASVLARIGGMLKTGS